MGEKRSRARVIVPLSLVLVLVPALTVWADHPPAAHMQFHVSHFNGRADHAEHGPDDDSDGDPGETSDAQIIGDLFDGIDHLTTLRAVAAPETTFYEWHECTGTSSYDPTRCRLLARDDTPLLSTSPAPGIAQVAVFEATFDIGPPTTEGIHRLVALACTQDSLSKGHCLGDASGVHFDDSQSTLDHPATESGQILRPIHGQAVANSGFAVLAFTSQTDIGRIMFCLDIGTNATRQSGAAPENGCDQGSTWDPAPDDTPACDVQAPPNSDCWSATINPPDNIEFSLSIIEQDDPTARVSSGSGDCEDDTLVGGDGVNGGDDCQLDKIYLTSMANPPPPPPAPWPFPGEPPPPVTGKCPGFEEMPGNHVVGGDSDDTLEGTPGADVICGLLGNDTLRGLGGNDLLLGGDGDDRIAGGAGSDRLRGEKGSDSLHGGRGRDSLSGGPGRDFLAGGKGRDRCGGGEKTRSCER
ncbi:MAG: calcium-binding protein [Actinomycetota bacterium]